MKDRNISISFGKLNIIMDLEVGQRFRIIDFPTIYYFQKGKHHLYEGPLERQAMSRFFRRLVSQDRNLCC